MKSSTRWIILALGVANLAFGSLIWRSVSRANSADEPLGNVPDFSLPGTTAEGDMPLSRADLAGRFWIANFIFTRCSGPCPIMTGKLAMLQPVLPADVLFVSFSVDPDRDDLDSLRRYARQFEADPKRWRFVRPEKGDLYRIAYEGFRLPVMEDPAAPSGYRVTHSTKFVLVDGEGRIRGYFDSDAADVGDRINAALGRLRRSL